MKAGRPPLTPDRIVEVAAALADRDGVQSLTLAMIARELGVRTPSLYNHVDGLDGLHRALTVRAMGELGGRLQRAAVGRAGDDAVRALAVAYRDFAHERPGLYALTIPSAEGAAPEIEQAAGPVVDTVVAVMAGYGFHDDVAIHATRTLRSLLHGFVSLELAGGFGLPVDLEGTFRWLLEFVTSGFDAEGAPTAGHSRGGRSPEPAPAAQITR